MFLQSASAQKFLLTDVKANRVGGLAVPGAKRVLLFYAERARHDSTVLRQYWLDEQMRLRNSHQLVLRGPYLLQGLLRSRSHVLYEFRRQGYDTLISVGIMAVPSWVLAALVLAAKITSKLPQ